MKNITAIFMILFFVSCKGETKQKEFTTTINNNSVSADSIKSPSQVFDWSMPSKLMDILLHDLADSNNRKDLAVVRFLKDYEALTERFCDSLFNQPNYEDLNTIAYSEDGKIKQIALDFQKKIITSGLNLTSSEGAIYVIENTDFIKKNTFKLLDKISIDFLTLYCKEFDTVCCDDASFVIPLESLVGRAYEWGEMTKKVSSTAYQKIAQDNYMDYLSLIFLGVDNSLAFDYDTKRYNQKLFDIMIQLIELNPTSKASADFKEFTTLLIKEDYQKTTVIDDFINLKIKK